ncbi:hypothetical protein BH23VER1_BH23VER1_00600 [soil metagenome]
MASDEATTFFETKIRPLLANHCYGCHSERAPRLKAGLRLDSAHGFRSGGDSGPVVGGGDAESSPLVLAVRRIDEDSAMPPKSEDALSAEEVEDLVHWVRSGAPYPDPRPGTDPDARPWWDVLAPLPPTGRPVPEVIDDLIDERLAAAGNQPVPPASVTTQVRRVTLDLVGRIPTVTEVKAYLASDDPHKWEAYIDRLLASEGFARQMTDEFNWMLMDGRGSPFKDFLAESIGADRGWDWIFRQVIAPDPPDGEQPPAASQFLRQRVSDLDGMTSDVGIRFFGVNVSCAQCHDHPEVPGWTQESYYGMKAFLSRTYEHGEFVGEREFGAVSYQTTDGQERTTGARFLGGAAIAEPDAPEPPEEERKQIQMRLEELRKEKRPPPEPEFSRRGALVESALSEANRGFFARAFVNRIWNQFFGRGLAMPLDQLHGQNRPSHPELLEWLARDTVAHGYDLRRLVRAIVLSDAYRRGSVAPGDDAERPAADLYAVAAPRPLTPRQYGVSLKLATEGPDRFPTDPESQEFRDKVGHFERGDGLAGWFDYPGTDFQFGVGEALRLSNDEQVIRDLLSNGLVRELAEADDPDAQIEMAYWAILSRPPAPDETLLARTFLERRRDRPDEGLRQMTWALLTSAEARFNH